MLLKISALLFSVVLVCAAENECGEERAGKCVERLLDILLDDITEEQACVELQKVHDCLQNTVDECLGDDRDERIDQGLNDLNKLLQEECPPKSDEKEVDPEIEICFAENKEYFLDCIVDSILGASDLLGNPDEVDMDVLKCAVAKTMTECLVERVHEKCGEKGREMTDDVLKEMTTTMGEGCSAPESVEYFSSQILELKKKK